jgi:hypothetical protein
MAKLDNVALVKLDGTLIKKDGTQEKSNFFDFLQIQPDDYSDMSWTPEEANRIKKQLQRLSTGASAALPITCGGPAICPFADRCVFVVEDKKRKLEDPLAKQITPVGKQCLVELNLLDEWTRLYIEEYGIEPDTFTEFQMVRELAEIELMLWRLNNNMAKPEHSQLVQETIVGITKEGTPLTRWEVSAFFEAKERLQNRKSRLVKLMVGDRQEKYKRVAALRQRSEDDPSISAAKLRSEIERVIVQAKNLHIQLDAADGNIIDVKELPQDSGNISPEDLIEGKGG